MRSDSAAEESDGSRTRGRFQPVFHYLVTHDSSLLAYKLPAGEDSKIWNSSNIESSRQLLVLVGVHFEDDRTSGHIGGRARNLWSRCPARPAPLSPEIDKHRHLRTLNHLVEQFIVRLHRLVNRRQRSLARAATARVRKVFGADTIFLTTLFTASNRRHSHLRSTSNLVIQTVR
jgi:hypothetical protein